MEKQSVSNLVIEVTRRCNMSCGHCLRGDQQNMDIDGSYIINLLNQVDNINTIIFTGGEPSLYPSAINKFVDVCKERGIYVSNFYVATNGKIASIDFIFAILNLWVLCQDNEVSSLDISNDYFHEEEGQDIDVVKKLKAFSFTRIKNRLDERYIISEGRGIDYGEGRRPEPSRYLDDLNLYLNCEGYLINGCDWSYDGQGQHIIGDVKKSFSLEDILSQFEEYS